MGLFDLPGDAPSAPPTSTHRRPQVEERTGHAAAVGTVRAAIMEAHAHRQRGPLNPKLLRDAVMARLRLEGWWCRTRYKVHSRGTPDGYRGVLDLVAHPPPARGDDQIPAPVLVEFDRATIHRKTLAKLERYDGTRQGVLIVLTMSPGPAPAVHGVDEVLTLG